MSYFDVVITMRGRIIITYCSLGFRRTDRYRHTGTGTGTGTGAPRGNVVGESVFAVPEQVAHISLCRVAHSPLS